jgi:hypothetical protein
MSSKNLDLIRFMEGGITPLTYQDKEASNICKNEVAVTSSIGRGSRRRIAEFMPIQPPEHIKTIQGIILMYIIYYD